MRPRRSLQPPSSDQASRAGWWAPPRGSLSVLGLGGLLCQSSASRASADHTWAGSLGPQSLYIPSGGLLGELGLARVSHASGGFAFLALLSCELSTTGTWLAAGGPRAGFGISWMFWVQTLRANVFLSLWKPQCPHHPRGTFTQVELPQCSFFFLSFFLSTNAGREVLPLDRSASAVCHLALGWPSLWSAWVSVLTPSPC